MLLTTHFILLLFMLGSSAHSLSRIQIINGSDIYEVGELPNNTFEVIEPKLKVPTLREIIYLMIKETPSKGCLEKEKLPQAQGPEFDDSERPYTNGQGFPFLELRPIEEQKSSDSSDSDSGSTESVPDSDESSSDSDDSNDSDSDENNDSDSDDSSDSASDDSSDSDSDDRSDSYSDDSSDSDSDDSSDSDRDDSSDSDSNDSSDSDSDSSSHENWPDSNENNKNSDDSKESNSDNHESKPDSHESNKDSDDSRLSNSDNHDTRPDSLESNKDSDHSRISEIDNQYIPINQYTNSNNDSGSNGSTNNSKEANKGNSGIMESKNDSKENYNDNIGSIGSNESKNNSKETNKGNSGSNESKNDSHPNQNNSNKAKTDNHNESKADNDNFKGFSSDADNGNDKDNEDKENDSRDTIMGLDERSGGSRNVNEISENITPDTSQSTEPAAAVSKNEADSTKLLRRKRDIDFGMVPAPPVLQPLNTRMLPDFIQKMLSNIPALKDVTSPDERGESNYENENRPQNYGFHFNNDNGRVWNNFPFINQENYINEPSNMINKEKQEEYLEDVPDSDATSSYDNSLYSDNDSGYNAEIDEETDKSGDDNSIDGVWPNIGAPVIDFNNFMPHNPITRYKEFGNFGNKIKKNSDIVEQREPTIELTTETNIQNRRTAKYKKSTEKEPNKGPIYTPPPKTKININKDLKEKIEMSFDNIGKIVPPILTRFEENLVKTTFKNNETPLTFGIKLSGENGYVWNDLADPGKHYLFGETIDTDKEWNEPSSPATEKFHEYNTEPTSVDENATEANEPTNSPIHKDEVTTQRVPESSTESQSQKPTTEFEKLNEPNKDSIDKDKDKLDDKKDNEAVPVALDDLLKKDEFWQWLTKWTAAYIGVLNEHVEKLVKKEVAKQVNKIMNEKVEKEKDKIDTNNGDLFNKNETIANVTIVEPANTTNEINTNNTTTEKSIPEANNTNEIDTNNTTTEQSIPEANNTNENIVSEKDQINAMNKTTSDGHKSNKTTPTNTHTIYGNAIDSDHVTNIFIFYPNAQSNATAKDIEAILGNKNNNVVVLGKPPNDNKESKAPQSSTNSPFDDTTGIYAIDQKKDIVSKASEQTSQAPETAPSQDPSATDLPVTAKIEDSTAATKPDASSTTEPTSSNSEPIANVSTDTVSSNTTESTSAINPEATTDDAATPSTIVPDTSSTAPVQ